jgi:hypothetical protein
MNSAYFDTTEIPDELLKNPECKAIQAFMKRKVKLYRSLKNLMIFVFIVYIILLFLFEKFHTKVSGLAIFDNILNLFPLILFPILAFVFYNHQKKYDLSEKEIDNLIAEIRSKQLSA